MSTVDPARRATLVRAPKLLLVGAAGVVLAAALTLALFRRWPPARPWVAILALGAASVAAAAASLFETRRDRILAAALAAASALLYASPVAGWAISSFAAGDQRAVAARARGKPAPDFALRDLDGRTIRLSNFRGKVVVLEVCRTWREPCRRALPDLAYASRLLEDDGLVVLGLDDESRSDQVRIRDEYGVPFPLLVTDQNLPRPYSEAFVYPTTFLIGRDGRIVDVGSWPGEEGIQRLAREVRGLAADPPLEEILPAVFGPPPRP